MTGYVSLLSLNSDTSHRQSPHGSVAESLLAYLAKPLEHGVSGGVGGRQAVLHPPPPLPTPHTVVGVK